jgi:DNA polymerase III subunit alpha
MSFSHLHCHSFASLVDGVSKPSDIPKRAKELGQDAIALTDHGTLAGTFEFQKACIDEGIKPIIGNEMYICEDMSLMSLTDEEKEGLDKEARRKIQSQRMRTAHIILLAQNQKGIENLYNLNYHANAHGFYYRPRIDLDLLEEYSEGIVATTTCVISQIARYFLANEHDKARKTFERMYDIFGKDRLFIEMHPHEIDIQVRYNEFLIEEFRKKYPLKCTLANDAHYLREGDNEAHKFLLSITTDDMVPGCNNLYIASEDDLRKFWHENGHSAKIEDKYLDEACETTAHIAEMCNGQIDMKTQKEPTFVTPDGYDDNTHYLRELLKESFTAKTESGLIKPEDHDAYFERLTYEFNTIKDKGYIDYFLIVRDFIVWAKEQNIIIGPGRGSAAGSLLSWFIEITEIDPIKYDLSFDRFLNPLRDKAPDIDTDLQDDKRDDVRQYVADRWGDANIAPIGAYNRYTANNLFREVCKSFEYNFEAYNKAAKNISSAGKEYKSLTSFREIAKKVKEVTAFLDELDDDTRELTIDLVCAIEGNYRNLSTAAAGTIISSEPLNKVLPLRKDKNGAMITEWQGTELTKAKYLKIDMLGISTLSVIKRVMDRVGMTLRELYDLPMLIEDVHDPAEKLIYEKCYEEFQKGHTEGVFQFESAGMTELLKNVKPTNIEDLCAVATLYRPGTLGAGFHVKYYKRKNGKEKIVNEIHPAFDDILESTYGLLIYQEQLINILSKMGLDYGEADLCRNAMQEYKTDDINKYLSKLTEGKEEDLLLSKKETKEVVDKLTKQAGYQFNRSHSFSYSVVSFWTMYIKVKYPRMFCEETLNNHIGNTQKLPMYINMSQAAVPGLEIEVGDINHMSDRFVIDDNKLRLASTTIKGIGNSVIKKVAKSKGADWESFQGFFLDNMATPIISDSNIRNMISIGFFDNMPFSESADRKLNRATFVGAFDLLVNVKSLNKTQKQKFFAEYKIERTDELFDLNQLERVFTEIGVDLYQSEFSERDRSIVESELIGFSVSSNMSQFIEELKENGVDSVVDYESKETYIHGTVVNIKEKKTKKGAPYLIVKIADDESNISFKVWANQLSKCRKMLINGNVIMVRLSNDSFGYTLTNDPNSMLDKFALKED